LKRLGDPRPSVFLNMQITRQDLNPCTVQLDIACEPEEVRAGFEKAYKQLSKHVRIPGFRPGHAPRNLVEQRLAKADVLDQAAENIVRSTFKEALTKESLEPYSQPSVELKELEEEEPKCAYSVKVPLRPIVELGEYMGLEAEQPPIDVTEEEVEAQIEDIRRKRGTREAVTNRGVQEGDVAVVNVKVDGETGEGKTFMTIAGQTFPQLDQALMGMQAEELKSLDLTFPENFQEKDWAGKTLHAQVTLRSLSAVKLPELDDEFAQSLSAESVESLRTRVRELVGQAKLNMAHDYVVEQLLESLLSKSTIHVPDTMWESVANRRLQELEAEQREKGKSLEEYAKEQGMTVEGLVEAWRNEAKLHVQRAVAVREIFSREKLKLNNNELNRELMAMAQEFETDPAELLNVLKKNNALDELHFRAIFRKVTDLLKENAKIREVAMAAR
jgi:trigger factor